MPLKFPGAITVVTGASSGIGQALSLQLLDRGATVIGVARRAEKLQSLAQHGGNRFVALVGDVTEAETRRRIFEAAQDLGDARLDLLVNNAGIGGIGRFADASPERLRRMMEVNFFAPAELTRQLLPLLRRGHNPVICNISSVLGHRAVPDKSEYCASKFALHGWSDALRAELAADGIQVTLISPSTTRSEFFDSLIDTAPDQNSQSFGSWSPEKVASVTLSAIESGRAEVICSLGGKLLVYADRLMPGVMNRILARKKTGDA